MVYGVRDALPAAQSKVADTEVRVRRVGKRLAQVGQEVLLNVVEDAGYLSNPRLPIGGCRLSKGRGGGSAFHNDGVARKWTKVKQRTAFKRASEAKRNKERGPRPLGARNGEKRPSHFVQTHYVKP